MVKKAASYLAGCLGSDSLAWGSSTAPQTEKEYSLRIPLFAIGTPVVAL